MRVAKRPRASGEELEPRSWLADLPIAALRLLDKLALGPMEEAFADLKQRVQAWTAAWESDDPELDPEEDVGCNDVEGGV